jgi:cell division ATPase FtsA
LKKDYSQGLLSEEVRQRIKEILSSAAQNWLKELKLKVTAKKILFPFDIFLFGGGSLIPEIQEVLEQSFSESHQIRYLYPKDLKGIKVSLKILTSPKDVPILLLCYL